MTIASIFEFNNNQKKYFDMAVTEQVFIKRGKNRFRLMYEIEDDNEGDNDTLLALAKSRMNEETINSNEFRKFLRSQPL